MFNIKAMFSIFTSVFLAELGDKTQVATVCFVGSGLCGKWEVFIASGLALLLSTLIAVLVGEQLAKVISPNTIKTVAGGIFIIMGIVFLYQGLANKG